MSGAAASSLSIADDRDAAILALGRRLRAAGYAFTTVTPETHRRVLARGQAGLSHRDIFGWNRPFAPVAIDPPMRRLLQDAAAVRRSGDAWVSTVRYATHGESIFVHSGFPTLDHDAVFFGPDTHRFLGLIDDVVGTLPPPARIADIGTGAGAAAIALGRRFPRAHVVATDINDEALRFTGINAALNEARNVTAVSSDVTDRLGGEFDLIVANPPYLVDPAGRRYRHGGGPTGAALSLRILEAGAARLSPHGHLVLYTGVAIVDGRDAFHAAAVRALDATPWRIRSYREIDPDVFGEELAMPAYTDADRIAVVGLVVGPRRNVDPRGRHP